VTTAVGMTAWLSSVVGRRLGAVTESRHWYEGRRGSDAESLIHVWLHFTNAAPVRLHGRGDQLLLAEEDPYCSYDMDRYGETKVGPAAPPDVLAGFTGATLTDGAVITGPDGEAFCAGLVLRFAERHLVIGALTDEWVLAVGPVPESAAPSWTVHPFLGGSSN
jgi:hypothetical protein